MSRPFLTGLLAGSALLVSSIAHAEHTPPKIVVNAPIPKPTPNYSFFLPDDLTTSYTDGGDLLNSVVGVSSGRLGGHGTDPVIRGQQQTQLNIITDGAMVHGGCPSRMDPPSSFVDPATFESITILKGYQSVRYGAGGTGGTVIFDRKPVPFESKEFNEK